MENISPGMSSRVASVSSVLIAYVNLATCFFDLCDLLSGGAWIWLSSGAISAFRGLFHFVLHHLVCCRLHLFLVHHLVSRLHPVYCITLFLGCICLCHHHISWCATISVVLTSAGLLFISCAVPPWTCVMSFLFSVWDWRGLPSWSVFKDRFVLKACCLLPCWFVFQGSFRPQGMLFATMLVFR